MNDRHAEQSKESTIASLFLGIINLPQFMRVEETEAFLVFTGLGDLWRTEDAISFWEKGYGRFLLVAGNNKEETEVELSIKNLMGHPFHLTRTENVHIQFERTNAKIQSEWAAETMLLLGIQTATLFVSPYHMLRAYLTLVKSIQKRKMEIRIIPRPTPVPPATITPETGWNGWEMLPAEIIRIKEYQDKGDVATLEELQQYLRWFWSVS